MITEQFDKGSSIVIEVETELLTPHAGLSDYTPDSPVISVIDPNGETKVDQAAMTEDAEGKLSYVVQTGESWPIGLYNVKIGSSSGIYTDITFDRDNFELI